MYKRQIYVIAIVAAGFAFWENIKYLADHEKIMMGNTAIASGLDPTIYLSQLSFLRSIFGNISHVLFSAVVGYFFARGIFGAFDIIDSHRASKQTTWLRFLWAKQFVRIYLFKMSIIGLIIATLVHTVYNFFMSWEQLFWFGGMPGVIITLLVGVGVFEMYVLRERRYVTDYGSIAEKIELGQQIRQVKGKQR